MPLTKDLAFILEEKRGTESSLNSLAMADFHRLKDFELALSYLAQGAPWKDRETRTAHLAVFEKIAKRIFREIMDREGRSLNIDQIPDWLQNFIRFVHKSQSTVITFNYDTILERATRFTLPNEEKINFDWMYPKIMTNAKYLDHIPRLGPSVQQASPYPFVKLHGSINWYYTGDSIASGQQFVFTPFEATNPSLDLWKHQDYLIDKEPLLIPPIAEKSPYYASSLVRTLWKQAHSAISEATHLYFLGYSLPETDLTTRLLLSAVSPAARISIVNTSRSQTKESLKERYQRSMPHVTNAFFDTDWVGTDSIPSVANDMSKWGY